MDVAASDGASSSSRSYRSGDQAGSDSSLTTSCWFTATPLGCPVEPEVKMTYPSWSGWIGTPGSAAGSPARAGSSTATTGTPVGTPVPRIASSTSSTAAPAWSTTHCRRSAGYASWIGR